jgi:hypothetical protein
MSVVMVEDFPTMMARMKAAKPEIMKPQTEGADALSFFLNSEQEEKQT